VYKRKKDFAHFDKHIFMNIDSIFMTAATELFL